MTRKSRAEALPPRAIDLAAFIAVLVTGTLLIALGRPTPQAFALYATALGALYLTWRSAVK